MPRCVSAMSASFIPLHVHSLYSLMRGVSSLEEICQAVRADGGDMLALTDTNGLYGVIRFIEVANQHGLRPIVGAEVVHGPHRVVVLAKNATGYENLSRI